MTGEPTLLRHDYGARLVHGAVAVAVFVLVLSGLGLAGWMPDSVTHLLGGHLWVDTTHRVFGLVFSGALVLVMLVAPVRTRNLLDDVAEFYRSDTRWPLDFLRSSLRPRRNQPPHHHGRFDPVQRVVFIGLSGALALLAGSGIVLYFAPPYARLMLAWMIRIHIFATFVLIFCACFHVLAGSGILPTHRGVARAMFGNGRVKLSLARRLWPIWAQRQENENGRGANPTSKDGDSGKWV